jgi:large subunit ribosomal protein L13
MLKKYLTGKKLTDKEYVRHSGYPGGQIVQTPNDILKKYPERLSKKPCGMLPKNRLGE